MRTAFGTTSNTSWSAAVIPEPASISTRRAAISEIYVDNDDNFSGNPVANADERSRALLRAAEPVAAPQDLGGWANAELRYTIRGEKYEDNDLRDGYSQIFSAAALTGDPYGASAASAGRP